MGGDKCVFGEPEVRELVGRYLQVDQLWKAGKGPDVAVYQRALMPRQYERLEFLGDAVLYASVAAYLHQRYPDEGEGFLTRVRTRLVNGVSLAHLCRKATSLPMYAPKLAAGEAGLEDMFEAFLGAVYLDLGFDAAKDWLVGCLETHVDFAHVVSHQACPKDQLHQLLKQQHTTPRFEVAPTDKEHDVCVHVRASDGTVLATGRGKGRREAEVDAARNALMYLGRPAGSLVAQHKARHPGAPPQGRRTRAAELSSPSIATTADRPAA